MLSTEGEQILYDLLQLDKPAVAAGEYWRLWTVTLLHSPTDPLHLIFNMYALYLAGTIVERWYGLVAVPGLLPGLRGRRARPRASCSVATRRRSVRPGAIFGLFGILLAAGRIHHPVDRQSRGVVSQLMFLVIINIVFGFASGGSIDNAAHLGGLAAGLWLGALIPPTGVPTMSSLWHKPGETPGGGRAGRRRPAYVFALGIAVVGVVVVAGRRGRDGASGSRCRASPSSHGRRPTRSCSAVAGSSPITGRLARRRRRRAAVGQRRGDGGLVRQEAVVLADGRHQPGPAHPVADRAADLAEAQLDRPARPARRAAPPACPSSRRRSRPSRRCRGRRPAAARAGRR